MTVAAIAYRDLSPVERKKLDVLLSAKSPGRRYLTTITPRRLGATWSRP
jgi:hypothetical protein